MERRSFLLGMAACAVPIPVIAANPVVVHPDGRRYVRINDRWLRTGAE